MKPQEDYLKKHELSNIMLGNSKVLSYGITVTTR